MNTVTFETPLYVYGFVEGDVIGLFICTKTSELVQDLRDQLLQASDLRTGKSGDFHLRYKNNQLPLTARIHEFNIQNFERIDLVREGESNA